MGDSPAIHCSALSLILPSCTTGFLPRNALGDAAMAGAACSRSACQPSKAAHMLESLLAAPEDRNPSHASGKQENMFVCTETAAP